MKILVYIGSHDNNSINEALEQLDNGNEVLAVCCDKSLGLCRDNYYGSKPLCQLCIQANKVWKKKLAEKGAKVITLSNIIEETDVVAAKDFTFKYNDVKSLKGINYKGVEIGFGAFSTYVSISKNVMPEFSIRVLQLFVLSIV